MLPTLFKINGIEISSLWVCLVVAFFLFLFLNWKTLRDQVGNFRALDIACLSVIISAIISRLIYIFQNYSIASENGWYLLPVRDTFEGIAFFDTLPWRFFAFWQDGYVYYVIPTALMFSMGIVLRSSQFKDKVRTIYPQVWKNFLPALFIITLGFFLGGTYKGVISSTSLGVRYHNDADLRVGVQLFEVVLIALIYLLHTDIVIGGVKQLQKYKYLFFPVIWFVAQILLRFQISEYEPQIFKLDWVQIFYLFSLIGYILLSARAPKKSSGKNEAQPKQRQGINPAVFTSADRARYNLSFASSKTDVEMSASERLKSTANKIKRRAKA